MYNVQGVPKTLLNKIVTLTLKKPFFGTPGIIDSLTIPSPLYIIDSLNYSD